jgi:hypothetical protein
MLSLTFQRQWPPGLSQDSWLLLLMYLKEEQDVDVVSSIFN